MFTVTGAKVLHPVGKVYHMLAAPGDTPVTMPVPAPTVAILVLPLYQVPPPVASLRVIILPAATVVGPVGADGKGLTVIVLVA